MWDMKLIVGILHLVPGPMGDFTRTMWHATPPSGMMGNASAPAGFAGLQPLECRHRVLCLSHCL
jgi:hypothetical protein